MLMREKLEAKGGSGLILLYPLISHPDEFFIEDEFGVEEKGLRAELELISKQECYIKNVKQFVF